MKAESQEIHVLVVDDERDIRDGCERILSRRGCKVSKAENGEEALGLVEKTQYAIVLLDLKMPGMDGLEVLGHRKEVRPDTEILMMTAYATVDTAVQAMKEGAFDYLVKPFDPDEIEILIKKIVKHKELVLENILLRKQLEERDQFDEIIGKSDSMQRIFEMIRKVAPTDSTVLITGESGTGKELIAQAIHGNSARCYMPLITVNCGALPESLLESELFGYEKGAFTGAEHTKRGRFEMANGGTLFLDEIGDISLKTQVDLLRVLQQKELTRLGGEESINVDVRILAATNRDLEKAIAENRFRKDLFYRLNVISIHVPPLRERREDIPLLARACVRKCCLDLNRDEVNIAPSAMKLLVDYHWPGNVRELENVIERALVIGGEKEILPADLPFADRESMPGQMPKSLKAMEKIHINRVLEDVGWNISRAARDLGIDRQTLYNKIEKYGIKKG